MEARQPILFRYGRDTVELQLPVDALIYRSTFPAPLPPCDPADIVLRAVREPVGSPALRELLAKRRAGPVVVVVSDITRPIPYGRFLPQLLAEIEREGVAPSAIRILVATGMHRASTQQERREMLGEVAARYEVIDHDAADTESLVELGGTTHSGARVRINRHYAAAGFRIVTGLVEPHFMAGFSGGRKALCPGLVDLATIRSLHGAHFLASPAARNGSLLGNPLHEEALSASQLAGADFCLQVVLDSDRRLVAAFSGELERSHEGACAFVRRYACPAVEREADIAITSSGGHPLDATFYQCVKGFVSCLPAVQQGGRIISFGGCAEGVGSAEYEATMRAYAGLWREFLADIMTGHAFTKDQWQFQMHTRALERIGEQRLHFVTDGVPEQRLAKLSVDGHAVARHEVAARAQRLFEAYFRPGMRVAVFPEGPYCAPVASAG